MRRGTRAVSVSASEILRRNHAAQSGSVSGESSARSGSCSDLVASDSLVIDRGNYNICASRQEAESIDIFAGRSESDGPSPPSERQKLAVSRAGESGGEARGQGLAKETKKEPNSTGSKQSGISPCFHAPGILASRNPGSPPQRRRRSASLKTRQWSA